MSWVCNIIPIIQLHLWSALSPITKVRYIIFAIIEKCNSNNDCSNDKFCKKNSPDDQSICERKIGRIMKRSRRQKHNYIVRTVIVFDFSISFEDCGTCCEKIEVESTNQNTIVMGITGSYECYVDFYGRNVYKKIGDELYLYWMYGNVSELAITDRWMVILTYIVCP